jgi:hypothetical protein
MWRAIQYVGTPLTLIAFVAAIVAFVYRSVLKARIDAIRSAPAKERAGLIEKTLETYSIKDDNLTREQKFGLMSMVLENRIRRLKIIALTSITAAFIAAAVVIVGVVVAGPVVTNDDPSKRMASVRLIREFTLENAMRELADMDGGAGVELKESCDDSFRKALVREGEIQGQGTVGLIKALSFRLKDSTLKFKYEVRKRVDDNVYEITCTK